MRYVFITPLYVCVCIYYWKEEEEEEEEEGDKKKGKKITKYYGLGPVGGWLMDGVLVAIAVHGLLTWAGLGWGLWMLHEKVAEAIDDLDGNIAQAIQAVLQGAQDIEPINPIQAAIAGYIQQQFSAPTITARVTDASGKFSSEENNNAQ